MNEKKHGAQPRIYINKKSGSFEIIYGGLTWVSDGAAAYIVFKKRLKRGFVSQKKRLFAARKKEIEISGRKITAALSGYRAFGQELDVKILLTAEVTRENTVEFSIRAENEAECELFIDRALFPAPFNAKSGGERYHVDAMRQGFIFPDGYKKAAAAACLYRLRQINTGDCYMPIWGRVCGGGCFTAIVETPFDAAMRSSMTKKGEFLNTVCWLSSLGSLGYERRLRLIFHVDADYNTVAKDYRAYLLEKGEFVSIDEKIAKNPNVKRLLGCPVLHHKIYAKIDKKSKFYSPRGTNEILYATFEKRARQLERLKSLGLEKLYVHTDGWGKNGYDHDHPQALPPCEAAGGWQGMARLSEACRRLGYIFALHDQYRDYYYSSPGFDKGEAVMNIDRSHPYCSIWDGGEHTFLCAARALEYVKNTYCLLESRGVDVQGAYLDVFSVVAGDECFNPEHSLTREQSIACRAECFDYLNEKGLIMSSEEPAAQLLSKIALVHHGPFSTVPIENGAPVGIPVPLLSLVFHDAVMLPWCCLDGGWGIPKGQSGLLYCALCAGMPYFYPFGAQSRKIGRDPRPADGELLSDAELAAQIKKIEPLCALQAELYNCEMLRHELLGSPLRQRAVYSNGTAVTVDFSANTFEISRAP